MKRIIALETIFTACLVTLVFFNVLSAQQEILYSWDFNTPGNTEGWKPTHSLSPFSVNNGTLEATIIGSDPYMIGPGNLQIDASWCGYILIRMRNTHDAHAEFFWTTRTQPDFVAGYELSFTLIPDGEFHEYEVPIRTSDKWKGTVTRLRLDPGEGSSRAVAEHAEIEIDYIRVVHLGPRLEFSFFTLDREVTTAGDTAALSLIVKNTGDETVHNALASLQLDPALLLVHGTPEAVIPDVAPNTSVRLEWKIFAPDTGSFNAAVTVQFDGHELFKKENIIHVTSPLPILPADVPANAQAWSPFGDHWLLENGNIRLAFIKKEKGYGPIVIYSAFGDGWEQIGLIQPPGSFAFIANDDQLIEQDILPQAVTVDSSADSVRLVLTRNFTDIDGILWQFQFAFTLDNISGNVAICYQAVVNGSRKLLNFSGPIIRAGEGSFAAKKEEALFPGLEWLIDDEQSSSDLDVHPPDNARYLPHPYKVTIPFMSVTSGNRVIGLSWNPSQRWYKNYETPSPLFASPNTWEGQDNHLLGLVVPPVPQWREENAALATTPILLQADTPVKLSAQLFIQESEGQLSALKYWLDENGFPTVPEKPRSYADDIRLNCESFMDVLWDGTKKGWHMALPDPWGPQSSHSVANQVWLGAQFFHDPAKTNQWRDQMKALANKLLTTDHNPPALGWDFAFRYGELDQVWGHLKTWAQGHSANQMDDGGWLYSGDSGLKNKGETSLGTAASKTFVLLQAARITGDPYCLQHGLAGLQFMKQFRVPRGAQVWEVPLHAPDILAAARAVLAYTEGYKITGDSQYLDEAVRRAYAGLPFVYLWHAQDRPIMAYGSIPVFGATWYTSPWFGKLVQWNGLDYAYALLKLWEVDQSEPWKQIAEGLTICGMQLQRTADTAYPQNKGMYPDAYSEMLGDEAYYWDLAPTLIMQNVLLLEHQDPDVQTIILSTLSGNIHVNSGMNFSAELNGNRLVIRPLPVFADSAFFLIANIKMPTSISFAGQSLPSVKDVDVVRSGWAYTLDGNVIIKVFAPDSLNEIEIEPVSALSGSGGNEPQWEFNNDNYVEGWVANFDVTNLQISDGKLHGKSLGGDPWFTSRYMDLAAAKYDSLVVRMRVNKESAAKIFWITKKDPLFDEAKSNSFLLQADGYDHVYSIPLRNNPLWKGTIRQLRFDPTNQGNAEFAIDYIRLVPGAGTDVATRPQTTVRTFQLLPNYPNPFRKSTRIQYLLPAPAKVKLTVYDVLGRKVVEFSKSNAGSTEGSFLWNRRDESGRLVPSGVYFYRLTVRNKSGAKESKVMKLVLLPD